MSIGGRGTKGICDLRFEICKCADCSSWTSGNHFKRKSVQIFGNSHTGNGLGMRVAKGAFLDVSLSKMTLTIPAERLGNVELDERDAVVDIAIGLYKRQTVSLGRAAEVAGLSSPQFLAELGRRRIPINYGVEELRDDLTSLHKLA
jgi:predicted HTH domain antitoxin